MRPGARVVVLLLAGAMLPGPRLSAQTLGRVDFQAAGTPDAQARFRTGVLLLHNFEYEDAALAFRAARQADPDMALAYWGEAMTYNHPIWMEQDLEAARGVLAALGSTPDARMAKASDAWERDWLATLDVLYGEGPKEERDFAYRDAMRRMWEKYPESDEVAAFYALAILGTAHEGRDFATYMRAAAVVQPVFLRSPDHPGAAHYVIHAFDDPVHAPLGLPAARAYSEVAPDAGHAQHMTSHIFVAMGLWDDVVAANIRARDVQNRGLESKGRRPNVCGHYTSWLHYGYLQQGRLDEAGATMDACQKRMEDDPNASEVGYYVAMRARATIDAADWEAPERYSADLAAFPRFQLRYDFIDALAALRKGDPDRARKLRGRYGAPSEVPTPRDGILLKTLDGLLAEETRPGSGIPAMTEAAETEASLPFEFGPPATLMPPHELLAAQLAALGRYEEAEGAWDEQLARTPQRTSALLGQARTREALGDQLGAEEAYRTLGRIWSRADAKTPGLAEVRAGVPR